MTEKLITVKVRPFLYFSGRVADDLKVSCEKTVQLFQNAQMNEEIQVVLRNQMEKTFGTEGCNDKLFAVRSSAAGNSNFFIIFAYLFVGLLKITFFENKTHNDSPG